MIALTVLLISIVVMYFLRDENSKMKKELRHIASADGVYLSDDIMKIIK